MIAASLIRHLTEVTNAPVLYFFFRRIILSNRGPQFLVRDCSYQILKHCPVLQSKLKHVMIEYKDVEQVPFAKLWSCFVSAMTTMPKIYCLIDALDEMEAGTESFLKDLVDFGQTRTTSIKLAMTSRQLPYIEAVFDGQLSVDIRLGKPMVDKDIKTYVTQRLRTQQLRSFNEQDLQVIKEAICSKGHGLFLYARLMITEILQRAEPLRD